MMDDKNVIYNIGTLLSFQATNRILNPSQMLAGVSYRSFSSFRVTHLGNSSSLSRLFPVRQLGAPCCAPQWLVAGLLLQNPTRVSWDFSLPAWAWIRYVTRCFVAWWVSPVPWRLVILYAGSKHFASRKWPQKPPTGVPTPIFSPAKHPHQQYSP